MSGSADAAGAIPENLIQYAQNVAPYNDAVQRHIAPLSGALDALKASNSYGLLLDFGLGFSFLWIHAGPDRQLEQYHDTASSADEKVGWVGQGFLAAGGTPGPDDYGQQVVLQNSWQLDAYVDDLNPASQADLNQLNALENTARQRALTSDEASQLYDIMQRHTWWFANVPSTAAGAKSPLNTEQARLAFWGIYSASATTGSGDYYGRSLQLINDYMNANKPATADVTDPTYQSWVQSQANLAGLMNGSPNFDTERQVGALSDYADSNAEVGHAALQVVDLVGMVHGVSAAAGHEVIGDRIDDASGLVAHLSATGVGDQMIDTGMAVKKAEWRTEAHDFEQYGMANVVQEVNRATLQDLVDRGGVSLPSDWHSWDLQHQLDWAKSDSSGVGTLILDLDNRVAGNTGNHH